MVGNWLILFLQTLGNLFIVKQDIDFIACRFKYTILVLCYQMSRFSMVYNIESSGNLVQSDRKLLAEKK